MLKIWMSALIHRMNARFEAALHTPSLLTHRGFPPMQPCHMRILRFARAKGLTLQNLKPLEPMPAVDVCQRK